jgi:hypothetical protein
MVSRWMPLYMRCAGIVVLFIIVERGVDVVLGRTCPRSWRRMQVAYCDVSS